MGFGTIKKRSYGIYRKKGILLSTTENAFENNRVCETAIGQTYHAAAALLDLDRPNKLIAGLEHPLFSPTEQWEVQGVVNHVVFPTGTAAFGEDLYIYYGAADTYTAVAKVNMKDLLNELKTISS